MRKPRPTTLDRALGDVFRNLKPGAYSIDVEDISKNISFLGLAKLKNEGSTHIELDGKEILINPLKQERT